MDTIEKEGQRKRLNSIPIVNGIERVQSKDMKFLEVEQMRARKRSRAEDDETIIEKMEIIKNVKDEQYDMCVIETRVISGLIENVEEEKVRSLIECFNPIIRSSPDHIKQTMLDNSEKWEEKKNVYIGAKNYIVHGRQGEGELEEQLKEKSVEDLSEILINEIENRMPKHCGRCEEWYIVKLKDTPVIHCIWCKVGMHDCLESNEIKNCIGIKWLCKTCDPVFTKHYIPKLDRAAFFEGFEILRNLDKGKNDKVEVSKSIDSEEKRDQPEDQIESIEEENKEEPVMIDLEKENDERNKVNEESKKKKEKEDNETPKDICWYWKNRKCRYTTNCKQDHPEHCKDMVENGLCKDSKCKLIHPKICRNLFFKGYCPRGESCWFIHPSKCPNNPQKNIMQFSTGHQNSNTNQNQTLNSYINRNNNTAYNLNDNHRNASPPFLGMWPTIGNASNNNQHYGMNHNTSMMQMMQSMIEKMNQIDNKIVHLEIGRQMMH